MTADHKSPEHRELIALANQVMPFGKYKGDLLLDLPEPYLVWFHGEGWPGGALGERMAAMYEVKVNGLEKLLRPLVGVTLDAAADSVTKPSTQDLSTLDLTTVDLSNSALAEDAANAHKPK